MELCHNDTLLNSPAMQRLTAFIRRSRETKAMEARDFERFEGELHTLVMALEREFIGEELARYDVAAEEVEVDGKAYRYTLTSSETYLSAAGPVTVLRHRYRPAGRGSRSICPLE